MIPRILDKDAVSFTGGVPLSDAFECVVTETVDGVSELELRMPYNGEGAEHIGYKAIITAPPSPGRGVQPFRIYRIKKDLVGNVTVLAQHLSYDLAHTMVKAAAYSVTPAEAIADMIEDCYGLDSHFVISTTRTGYKPHIPNVFPVSARSRMVGGDDSIQAVYGGEWLWDGWNCTLIDRLGTVRDRGIAYADNLTALKFDVRFSEIYSSVFPYYKSGHNWASESPVAIPGAPTPGAVYSYDCTKLASGFPVPQGELTQLATAFIAEKGAELSTPVPELSVKYVPLEKTDDPGAASAVPFELGDTVPVSVPYLDVDVTARIVKTEYDVLRERYDGLEVGKAAYSAADTLSKLYRKTKALENFVNI